MCASYLKKKTLTIFSGHVLSENMLKGVGDANEACLPVGTECVDLYVYVGILYYVILENICTGSR